MFQTPQLFISSIFSWRGTRLRSEGRRLSKTENHQCCGLRWPWVSTSNNGILTKNPYINIPNHIHIISYYIILYHIISYYIILYHIVSYYIILYYIILYHIISYYIILYQIISYYIILYHIISYYIRLYQIISYYIILYHIISYYII